MHRIVPAAGLAAVLALSPTALAQGTCVFTVDTSQSSLTFGGTTSLGPIVGDPATVSLSGFLNVDLATESNPASTGQLAGGDILVIGGVHAFVPNVLPFLPPLAELDITNLRLSGQSNPFLGDVVGNFSTDVVITALSGTADVVPLVGDPSTVDLTGAASDPTPSAGTLAQAGSLLTLTVPFSSVIDLSDPASGVTGTATLNGTIVATHDLSSGCNTSMFATIEPLSLLTGGTTGFALDAGPSNGGAFYWVFGSVTGTSPGTPLGTVVLPLNFDPFFRLTLFKPFLGIFGSFVGFLDGNGQGAASFTIPPATDPTLAGLTLWFAYAAGPTVGVTTYASNAVSTILVP